MNVISTTQPIVPVTASRAAVRPAREAAAIAAPRNPHRFTDAMEAALTGIVATGVLLFAAALLRDVAPPCTARMICNDLLIFLAIISGSVSVLFTGRAIFGR